MFKKTFDLMLITLLIACSRLLGQHPLVLAKLRKEISSLVGIGKESSLPDRNILKKMKYLNMVIKEGISTFIVSTFIVSTFIVST